MPKTSECVVQSIAARLQPLLSSRKPRLTLGEMVAGIDGDDGLGPVLLVLSLPLLLPLPPGVSIMLALPLLVVAPQIIVGRQRLWLPETFKRLSVKRPALVKLLRRVLPLLTRIETVVRPRLRFLTGKIGACVVGIACTLVAVILILPIPLASVVPAFTLAAFSLGLTRKDGVFVLVGCGLLVLSVGVFALGVLGIEWGLSHLQAML
jgi:hypothetical protein